MVYKIKTMLKCLFIFVDQNKTKRNVITLFRLVLSRFLCLTSGAEIQGCQVFATKPAQLLLKTSPKLAQSHFEGGFPVKFAFQGLNITLLGSLQPADMKNNPRQQCSNSAGKPRTWQHSAQTQATSLPQVSLAALFRRRQQTKLSMTEKGTSSDFSLQAIQVTDTHFICTF